MISFLVMVSENLAVVPAMDRIYRLELNHGYLGHSYHSHHPEQFLELALVSGVFPGNNVN